MTQSKTFAFFATVAMTAALATPVHAAPKYGPSAVPLSKRSNQQYFRKNAAPDFWALIPYYLPQPNGRTCSAANLALVLNGARDATQLNSDQKLLTIVDFIKQYTESKYEEAMLGDSKIIDRSNLANKNIARLLEQAVDKLGIKKPGTKVELHDVDLKNLSKSKKQFVEALAANEKSSDDFIIISFIQGTLTGDPEGPAHVATVGAYDAKKKLVLVLDPDREWYEPYWSPVDKVFEAVSDPKSDGVNPGWIHFKAR